MHVRLMAIAVASCYATAPAWAVNEANFNAVVGSFTADQKGDVKHLTLTTATERTLAEIQKRFNLPADEKLSVIQPSSSSLFLLRVMRQDGILEKSVIDGSIYSNGQFWLQNAAGVLISKGAVIDTAGFLATSMAVRLEDFMAARLTTLQGLGSGDIVNRGEIKTSSGGSVYLIGANVSNEGLIETPGGETILAAGQTVNLIDTGTPGVKVEVTGAEGNATNLGEIVAKAGRIGMAGVIVRNSGTLNASSVVSEGGRVFLKASKDTYVDGKGRIVATGTKGGKVEVLGRNVTVTDEAEIDASGVYGGGTILVGGDYRGKNPDVQNAWTTYFGAQAKLKADAITSGDGGKVIVWADDTTRAYGNIYARGGSLSGNGGFVEVSGHRYLDYQGIADRSALKGKAGTLLLDPANLCVYDSSTAACSYGASLMSWATIDANLYGGAVQVSTDGSATSDIQVVAGYTYNRSNNLSFLAYGNFSMLGPTIQNNGTGDITVVAGWTGSGTNYTDGYGSINIGGNSGGVYVPGKIITGGNIYLYGGNSIGIDYLNAGGNILVKAGRSIWDNNWQSSGTANLRAVGGISLSSDKGWNWGDCSTQSCVAISADVESTSGITATVGGSATYGGIRIGVSGDAPTVSLSDYSTSSAYNAVELHATQDVNTSGSTYYGNKVYIEAGRNLIYSGGISSPGTLQEVGLMAAQNLTINAAIPTTSNFTALFGGSSVTINSNVSSNGFVVFGSGVVEKKDSVESPSQLGDIPISTGGTVTINNATVTGANGVGFLTGNLTLTNSTVSSSSGPVFGALTKELRLNNGSMISSGGAVSLALLGADSAIYLNDSSGYANPSKVVSGSAINVKFLTRSGEGVVINGETTTSTTYGGSGFYVAGSAAQPGSGLNLVYSGSVGAVQADVINTIIASTTSSTPSVSSTTTNVPPPTTTTTTTSGGIASLGSGTVGGAAGQFGDTSSSTSATTTTTTSTSGDSTSSGSTSTSTSSSSSSGDSANGSKDAKEEKKEEKKDDRKKDDKKADSGEKKDDKAKQKPVGKCSA